jgi:enoyl-CoA hydratase
MATIALEVADGVAVLTFTRPPKNWMNLASLTEMVVVLEDLATRPDEVTVVMLTGGVDGYFVAHADFDDLRARARGQQASGDPEAYAKATALLESMPQPTVAAIDGQAGSAGGQRRCHPGRRRYPAPASDRRPGHCRGDDPVGQDRQG